MAPRWKDHSSGVVEATLSRLPVPGQILEGGGPLEFEDRKVIPSLLERVEVLSREMDLDDPRTLQMIDPRDAVAFGLGHGFETDDLLEYLSQRTDASVSFQSSPLHRWLRRLKGFKKKDVVPLEEAYRIPVAELHCPDFPGCETSYSSGSSRSEHIGLLISARGARAGGGVAGEVTINQKVVAKGSCIQVTVPGRVKAIEWNHAETGETIFDVQVSSLGSTWGVQDIPHWRRHDCASNLESFGGTLVEWERLGWIREEEDYVRHPLDVDGDVSVELAWSRRQKGRFNLSIMGILDIRSEFSTSHEFSYALRSRNEYVGYYEDAESEVRFWSWKYASPVPARLE